MVEKITLKLPNGDRLELTLDEAKKLHTSLSKLFTTPFTANCQWNDLFKEKQASHPYRPPYDVWYGGTV